MDTTTIAIIINLTLLGFFSGWILYHVTVWVYERQYGPCFRGPLSDYKWPCKVPEKKWNYNRPHYLTPEDWKRIHDLE